jgi:alpha-N-arabinofuranosidase
MFSANRGTTVLPLLLDGSTRNGQGDLFAVASLDDRSGEVILKLVNAIASPREVRIGLAGAKQIAKSGKAYVLASSDLKAENSLDEPMKVAPVEQSFVIPSDEFAFTLAANSLTVLRVGISGK